MKKLFVLVIGFLAVLYGLNQYTGDTKVQSAPPLVQEEELSVWLVTDIHYLSPRLHDDGEAFNTIVKTTAGKDLARTPQLMEALVWQLEEAAPDLLIVSGDLTFNGEKQSAVELAGYFERIEANGTQVAVIPGNHDIHNGWAREYVGEEQLKTEQISPEDFQTLFADYGYDLAVDQDSGSLSYIIEPKTGYPFLMLDTNKYSSTKGYGNPETGGEIKADTYGWLEDYFEENTGLREPLVVMHHNVMSHNQLLSEGYTVDGAEKLQAFLTEEGVETVFSGHIHAQDISSAELEAGTLYEVVTGALSVYPNSISQFTVAADGLSYSHETLDVEDWAQAAGTEEEALLQYADTNKAYFTHDSEGMALSMMFEERWYEEEYEEPVMSLVGELNTRYFAGEDYVDPADQTTVAELTSQPGYRLISENSPGFLKRYTQFLLQDQNMDDQELYVPFQ